MPNVGKITTLAILGVAAALATGTVWYRRQAFHRVLELWGPEAVAVISRAPRVELQELDPSSNIQKLIILRQHDVQEEQGLNLVRQALVQDSTYDWNIAAIELPTVWQAALRFENGETEATVLLSFDGCRVTLQGGSQVVTLQDVACAQLRKFVEEQSMLR